MGSKIKTEAVLAVEQATSWNGLHLKFLPSSAKTSEKRLPMNQQSCIQQWQEFTSWEPLKWLEENKPAHSHEVWFSHLSNSLHLSIDFGGPSGFFPLWLLLGSQQQTEYHMTLSYRPFSPTQILDCTEISEMVIIYMHLRALQKIVQWYCINLFIVFFFNNVIYV